MAVDGPAHVATLEWKAADCQNCLCSALWLMRCCLYAVQVAVSCLIDIWKWLLLVWFKFKILADLLLQKCPYAVMSE